MRFVSTLTLLLPLALSGCGTGGDTGSHLASPPPNLRFIGSTISIATGSGALVTLAKGATIDLPCGLSNFRAQYKYGNSGPIGAGLHKNISFSTGGSAYSFAQAALAAGATRVTWASFGAIVTPNVPTTITIRLDGTDLVSESDETDNAWFASVVRKCP